jgi:hypothetical protein
MFKGAAVDETLCLHLGREASMAYYVGDVLVKDDFGVCKVQILRFVS